MPTAPTPSRKRQRKPKEIPASLPKTGLVRSWVVLHFFPFSDEHLRRQIAAGSFPAPVKIGKRAVAWEASKLHAHLEQLGRGAA